MALHAAVLPVPPGLTLGQHSAAAQHLLAEFLADCAAGERALASRPVLRLRRPVGPPIELELADGTTVPLPLLNMWTVEADVAD